MLNKGANLPGGKSLVREIVLESDYIQKLKLSIVLTMASPHDVTAKKSGNIFAGTDNPASPDNGDVSIAAEGKVHLLTVAIFVNPPTNRFVLLNGLQNKGLRKRLENIAVCPLIQYIGNFPKSLRRLLLLCSISLHTAIKCPNKTVAGWMGSRVGGMLFKRNALATPSRLDHQCFAANVRPEPDQIVYTARSPVGMPQCSQEPGLV